ncbi:MAG TPA: hypothetical protein DCM86_17450, partial [Verrucomicrobiales bacterium]|nr:hypothetical protein [Verrucomicrobiales bacterium]
MNAWIKSYAREWRKHPLLTAFVCSCLIHLLIFGLWRLGVLELPDRFLQLFIRRRAVVAER